MDDNDMKTADQLIEAVSLLLEGGPEALVGAKALLREIRDRDPDAIVCTAESIKLRRLGLRTPANTLPA